MSEPPRLDPGVLLELLEHHRIAHLLVGSVAAMAYGVPLVPGDLDIAPELAGDNLHRLGGLLRDLGARPKYVPGWAAGPDRESCERWQPEPFDAAALDHRFVTRHGELDVVPIKAGRYDQLRPSAVVMRAFGREVHVAHIDHLLAQLERWNRERDRVRRTGLVEARARFLAGETPPALESHPAWAGHAS
jgi:hypothetical protein